MSPPGITEFFQVYPSQANDEARQNFEKTLRELDKEFQAWMDAISYSEWLTEEAFRITIYS